MTQFDKTQEQYRQAVGSVRYSPWWLAVSTSLSLALFVVAVGTAYVVSVYFDLADELMVFGVAIGGVSLAFLVGVVMAPIPSAVVWWCWMALGVERRRLAAEPDLFDVPGSIADSGDVDDRAAPQADVVELMPGYELDGELVAPLIDSGPAEAELRRKCLALVRGGMKRGSWSRSKLAEGPSKQMKGDEWDDASRELQRLGYFASGPAGLAPVKPLDFILGRLELAR